MRSHRHRAGAVLLFGALLAFLAGCGDDGDETASTSTTVAPTTTTSGSTTSTRPTDQTEVRSYFLRDEKVGPVAREATDGAVAAGAIEGLLAGPTQEEQQLGFSSAIPAGTDLVGVLIEDGIATVDLSDEFG